MIFSVGSIMVFIVAAIAWQFSPPLAIVLGILGELAVYNAATYPS